MTLVDTAVWIDHFRATDARLVELLHAEQVACHPFVIGELACGSLRRRAAVLELLHTLPQSPLVSTQDALVFVDVHALMGKGLGWIDVHLLASAMLSRADIWTRDRRLAAAADRLGIAG